MINKSENKLNAEQMQRVVDGLKAGLWEWDFLNKSVWFSDNFYKILGYYPNEFTPAFETFYNDFIHEDDKDIVTNSFNDYLKNNKSYSVQVRIKTKSGDYKWFSNKGKLKKDANGKPLSFVGSSISIHDRKLIEDKLSESEFLLRESGRMARVGGWELPLDTMLPVWSKTVFDIHEVDKEDEFNLETAINFYHPDYRDEITEAVKNAINLGKKWEIELKLITAKNREIWVKSYGEPVYNHLGKIIKLRGIFADIDKYKKNEERLMHHKYLLDESGRIAKVGGFEVKLETKETEWSNTVFDIFEIEHNNPAVAFENTCNYIHPDFCDGLKTQIKNAIATGAKYEEEVILITAKKREIWIKTSAEPIYDHKGKIVALRGIYADIDQSKRNELALNKSVDLLTQQNSQLKNFTHILSHNLRNHAGNISMIAHLLKENNLDDDSNFMVHQLLTVSSKLNETLDYLSEMIKIKENPELAKEDIYFNDLVKEIKTIVFSELEVNQAKIITDFKVSHINYPKVYLESIILNLLTNAIKYRKKDSDPEVLLKTYIQPKTNKIVFECIDNGLGIDLKLHGKKVFGLYKTFHNHKDAHGVGLFLVKNQVESQGGEIFMESEPGKGTTMRIIF